MFGYLNKVENKINPLYPGKPKAFYFGIETEEERTMPGSYYNILSHMQVAGKKRSRAEDDDDDNCGCNQPKRKFR